MNTPINILIVDDEPKNLAVLEAILDDPGYRLVRASSADQALLALVNEEFALLILDIRMPEMTGIELAQMIKQRNKTARIPIIFLTAFYNEDQHVLAGYDVGAVDYLHKPVNPQILRSKVAVFAELYRKSRTIEWANRTLVDEVTQRRHAEERLRELNGSLETLVAERTAALRDADRRKDEFLATLAHELRNPLAPVRNAVKLLRAKGFSTPEAQWACDVIDRQTQHLARLVDELMDVSRISRGKIELKRDRVELSKVMISAVETSRPHIDEAGHELTMNLPTAAVTVEADSVRLTQVFLNLLNNAVKFTGRSGRIEVRAEKDGRDVVVSVKDTGIGIAKENLTDIFELFAQVKESHYTSAGGLGIGLSLSKRLVELHGGRIEAYSDGLGRGSEFVVRLPIVVDDPPPNETIGPSNGIPKSYLRVVVIDDNRDSAESLAKLLTTMGNVVWTAFDGEDGARVVAEQRPHVVICDIGLPKINGHELARSVRRQAWGKKMVLIAVSGWGHESDVIASRNAGFDHHRVKPVDPGDIMLLIASCDFGEELQESSEQ